jgi:hypothetical protein
MRWVGLVAKMEEKRGACRILVGRPDGTNLLGRRNPRWKDNITIDFQEVGWEGMDWIDLAHDRDIWRDLVNAEMKLRVA